MAVSVLLDSDEIIGESYAIDVERGRSLETEKFGPGGGTVRVHNLAANFNPHFLVSTDALLLESGDFLLLENGDKLLLESGNGTGAGAYGEIKLGRKVTIKDGGITVFTGFVEDFDFEYDSHGRADAILVVRDALATLGSTDLKEWTTERQLTGARVSALLDRSEVGFPTGASARSIATGTQPLGSGVVSFNTNALQEIQRINDAEYGRAFVDASGKFVFQDRYAVFGMTSSYTFDSFHGIDIRFGTELLHFAVSVTRDGSDAVQTSENTALIAEYASLGVRHLGLPSLPFDSDHHALGLTQLLLNRFSQFDAVISGLTVKLGNLSTSSRASICGLDIGDVVTVNWTPTGTVGGVSQVLAIEAVSYSVDRYEKRATISFQLSDASDPGYFVVGTDAVNGSALLAP